MTEPQPLKRKYCKVCNGFHYSDVASAVEWLKKKLIWPKDMQHMGIGQDIDWNWIENQIDEAFADVVTKK